MWTSLLALTLLGVPATPHATQVPMVAADVAELSTPVLRHTELLRITRDWGKPNWEIAIDGWVDRGGSHNVADVRVWWANTDKNDRRKPISKRFRKYFKIKHRTTRPGHARVVLTGTGKRFEFDVETDTNGRAHAFANIKTRDGTRVEHCRARRAMLTARRFLGIPTGLKHLTVSCVDGNGRWHRGKLVR